MTKENATFIDIDPHAIDTLQLECIKIPSSKRSLVTAHPLVLVDTEDGWTDQIIKVFDSQMQNSVHGLQFAGALTYSS